MGIKLLEDHLSHATPDGTTTKLAEVSATGLSMVSASFFRAQAVTASAGLCVTGSVRFLSNGTDALGAEEIEFTTDEVKVTGSMTITGDLTVLGAQTLGDAEADSLAVAGDAVFSNGLTASAGITPAASDGAALGSAALEWSDLYLADGAVLNFGDDQDTTLTHTDGSGLTLNSTNKIMFGDTGTFIHQSGDGVLTIESDTTVDINGAVVMDGALTGLTSINVAGTITGDTSLTLDGTTVDTAEIAYLADVTAGTAAASKAVVLDGSKNISTIGTVGCGAITSTGASTFGSVSPSSANGGALGGASAEWSDLYLADGGIAYFGDDQEITLTHVADKGLTLTNTNSGDDKPVIFQLKSEEDAVIADEVIASMEFAAGDSDGTDGATVAAGIHAIAEETFAADANATKLVFTTADSETAAASATAKMTLSSTGALTTAGSVTAVGSFIIGSADMSEADLEQLDGITAGTAAASKAVVLDGSKNIATIGTVGCGAITSTGASSMGSLGVGAVTATSLNLSEGNITNGGSIACDTLTSDAVSGLSLDGSSVTTSGGFALMMNDNLAIGFQIMQGANAYMKFVTSDSSEAITVHEDLTLDNDKDAKARSFITYSDATLKQDIKPLDSALDKVMSMRGVSYEFKNQASADGATHREVGFLAQEMKQTVPEVVYGSGDGNLGIDYAKLTSVLVEAVKSQQGQIEELRAALLKK